MCMRKWRCCNEVCSSVNFLQNHKYLLNFDVKWIIPTVFSLVLNFLHALQWKIIDKCCFYGNIHIYVYIYAYLLASRRCLRMNVISKTTSEHSPLGALSTLNVEQKSGCDPCESTNRKKKPTPPNSSYNTQHHSSSFIAQHSARWMDENPNTCLYLSNATYSTCFSVCVWVCAVKA